ncbi:MAG: Arc family DNA-binding protein [Planctomycetes bacterium]|nr:Arc family DNA-binding protein [Planctomycetota bacterium]
MMKNKNTFSLRLPEDQLDFLKKMAQREHRTVSSCIRILIDNEQKHRRIFKNVKP